MPPGLVTRAISTTPACASVMKPTTRQASAASNVRVVERQLLGHADPHVHAGVAVPAACDERRRRVDGRDRGRSRPAGQLPRQPAGSAADVEHPHAAG